MKHWIARELEVLTKLRARFLDRTAGEADYWRSDEELALYDETFAQRIGWKIDAAIRAASNVGWAPRSRRVVDWGCGTGIATRRVFQAWPHFEEAAFSDRSIRAVEFARGRLRQSHPTVRTTASTVDRDTLLVLSHVVSELPSPALDELLTQVRAAGEVLWVESGAHADSRRLIDIRERLLAEPNPPQVVAPCTHQAHCGLLAPANAQHWCHFFARPPAEVFQDARWAEWGRNLGIDLRALPFSYLILSHHPGKLLQNTGRILGGLRENKGYCRVLHCDASGVEDLMLQKRDAPELFRTLTKSTEWPAVRCTVSAGKIISGTPIEQ